MRNAGEVVALLTSPLRIPRPKIISFVNSLKQSPYVGIIHIDQDKDVDILPDLKERGFPNLTI